MSYIGVFVYHITFGGIKWLILEYYLGIEFLACEVSDTAESLYLSGVEVCLATGKGDGELFH